MPITLKNIPVKQHVCKLELSRTRAEHLLSGNKARALHMGLLDKFRDLSRPEKKTEVLTALYDLMYPPEASGAEHGAAIPLPETHAFLRCLYAFTKLRTLADPVHENAFNLHIRPDPQYKVGIEFCIYNEPVGTRWLPDEQLRNVLRKTQPEDAEFKQAINQLRAAMHGVAVSGINLYNTDLSRADLFQADLSYANLSLADLSWADLTNADLSNANLSDANLNQTKLSRANLCHANLERADLTNADLGYAKLRFANLRDADLRWADLRDTDLRWVDLRDADLRDADLSGADLSGADLRGAITNEVACVITHEVTDQVDGIPEQGAVQSSGDM